MSENPYNYAFVFFAGGMSSGLMANREAVWQDTFKLVSDLRADEHLKSMPVVLSSGLMNEAELSQLGCIAISKPFGVPEFKTTLAVVQKAGEQDWFNKEPPTAVRQGASLGVSSEKPEIK